MDIFSDLYSWERRGYFMENDKKVKFYFGSKATATGLGILGVLLIILSTYSKISGTTTSQIITAIGQTLLCACMISLLLEISTIKKLVTDTVKDGCQDVLEEVFGNEEGYIGKLSSEDNMRLRLRLCATLLSQKGVSFNSSNLSTSALNAFEIKIMDSLLDGITCEDIKRKIVIFPNGSDSNPEYKICITETYILHISAEGAVPKIRPHKFRFISKKQNDSFKLLSLNVNGEEKVPDDHVSKKYPPNTHTAGEVGNRTFVYSTEIGIPYSGVLNQEFHYQITYEYYNYEQSTYLTSALLYLTRNLEEEYCVEGDFAKEYIIHGFTHYPYHNTNDPKIYFKRVNSSALHTSFHNNWQLPATGNSVVVRKKTSSTEYLF